MKKINLIVIIMLKCCISAFSQAPQSFNYQAVARNTTGKIVPNKTLGIRISIYNSAPTGTLIYQESFTPKTNNLGLFTLNIGAGTTLSGTFSAINWGSGIKFLQVGMDTAGGTSYVDMGTTQLLSVPYALYANDGGPWNRVGSNVGLRAVSDSVGINKMPKFNLDVKNSINVDSFYRINGVKVMNTRGIRNLFIGQNAGKSNTSGGGNYFSGDSAGYSNTIGNDNYFSGNGAGFANTYGTFNYFSGTLAGNGNISGIYNYFSGVLSGVKNTSGGFNHFTGYSAGYNNTTASNNQFVGYIAGYNNTTGSNNYFSGYQGGVDNTTGSQNQYEGYSAGYVNQTGSYNYSSGYQAGWNNTVSNNHFVGYKSGYNNSTGTINQFEGNLSGLSNTTGNNNFFIGYQSGYNNTGGSNNQCEGYNAGRSSSNGSSGNNNLFIGYQAGFWNKDANNNHFLGYEAGYNNSSGSKNFFSGYQAGRTNTQGYSDHFSGYQSGYSNINGFNNYFSGYQAGYSNTTGYQNTFTGYQAGYSNTNGALNVFAGDHAGYGNSTGGLNCYFGRKAGYSNSTGNGNTAIGDSSGSKFSGTTSTFIGAQADGTAGIGNATAIGFGALVSTSFSMTFGNQAVTSWAFGRSSVGSSNYALQVGTGSSNGNGAYLTTGGTWTNASDRNKKENFSVLNTNEILNRIGKLTITRWNYKGEKAANTHIGPMAQDFYKLFQTGGDSLAISTIDPAGVALVGVQELKKENEALKQELESLKASKAQQDSRLNTLANELEGLKKLLYKENSTASSR